MISDRKILRPTKRLVLYTVPKNNELMKQIYALIVMLMMASVAFTGCVSDDGDDTDDTTVDDTTTDNTGGDDTGGDDPVDPVGTESTSTLDDVIAAGAMKWGVKTSQFGMGFLADDGTRSGLDIE